MNSIRKKFKAILHYDEEFVGANMKKIIKLTNPS